MGVTKGNHSNKYNDNTHNHTNNGETLVALMTGLSNSGGASSFSNVKWNGTNLIRAVYLNPYRPGAEIWYLDDAEQGAYVLTMSTGWPSRYVTVVSLIGTDISESLIDTDSYTAKPLNSDTRTLSPAPDSAFLVSAVSGDWGSDRNITWGEGQVQMYDAYNSSHDHNAGTSYALGGSTMYFAGGNGQSTHVAANFKAKLVGPTARAMFYKRYQDFMDRLRQGLIPQNQLEKEHGMVMSRMGSICQ